MNLNITCTPEELEKCLKLNYYANIPTMVRGSPGIGKSSIVRKLAKDLNLKVIDHRISTASPWDAGGFPDMDKIIKDSDGEDTRKVLFRILSVFPTIQDQLPINEETNLSYNGWILFLDEFNTGDNQTQASFYKVILDRLVAQEILHEKVYIIAAGNKASDRAIVNEMSTAANSRFINLELEFKPSIREDLKYFDEAVMKKWHPLIRAYLLFEPSSLNTFNPDNREYSFGCPRTWEYTNGLFMAGQKVGYNTIDSKFLDEHDKNIYGAIGPVSRKLITFIKNAKEWVRYEDIIKDPLNVKVPEKLEFQYGTATNIISHYKSSDAENVSKYIKRLNSEIQFYIVTSFATKLAGNPFWVPILAKLGIIQNVK